jgi:hypothetical protein
MNYGFFDPSTVVYLKIFFFRTQIGLYFEAKKSDQKGRFLFFARFTGLC